MGGTCETGYGRDGEQASAGETAWRDRIYRNETYGSFVIVRYKAMEDESGTPRFRSPDKQLATELERMEKLWAELQN